MKKYFIALFFLPLLLIACEEDKGGKTKRVNMWSA